MRRQWYVQTAGTALGAVLLAGCGGEQADTAAPLDQAQVRSVLPDAKAMPGWKTAEKPSAGALDSEFMRNGVCPSEGNKGCEGSRFLGSVTFGRADNDALVDLWMVAYEDEQAAVAAYDVLWKDTARKAGKEKAELGAAGEERDALRGAVGPQGAQGITGQIRVGTTILRLDTSARHEDELNRGFVQDIAALFARRAQQAQNGETPTAALADVQS
ncbi:MULTISPECIES: hypothetical protein [unclassified Streptomyces]|uniref:hypothetical protein n=1 Tax=unclassified Streptomyces TaxID=2593676 RepID=UPI00081F0F4B|nr:MULTISPECIES: hypothetical protein [unclassified Streptomyces]MYZ36888.1 hypothetical protein [Streptomyces sp. SID4917]SCF87049.1 hypothetical protein GA0115259_103933 [Streptomyces sp. MnatMP-M17]